MQVGEQSSVEKASTNRSTWWLLWAALVSLSWLVPVHAFPWTAFHAEMVAAIGAAPLFVWAVVADRGSVRIPREAAAVCLLAMVPLVQRTVGMIQLPGDAWLAVLYLLSFAAAIVVGARAQILRPWVMPEALFSSFAIAATFSVGLALTQWLQLGQLGGFVFALANTSRPAANVGQPNHLATLLVWGLLALWWAYLRGHVRGAICTVAAALLLFGVAMTQSRTGALEVLVLGFAAVAFRRQLCSRRSAWALLSLCVGFVLAFSTWSNLNEWLQLSPVNTLEQRMVPGTRWAHWQLLVDAIVQRPWAGWGWNQVVLAQVALASQFGATHEVIQYSHNVVLDLLVWNGIPLGLLACGLVLWWLIAQVRLAQSAERVLVLLAVAVFLLHAQLEFPHAYAMFLLPVGLMIGALHVPASRMTEPEVPRMWVALPFAALLVCLTLVIRDYFRIEQAWTAQRLRAARIGSTAVTPLPDVAILGNLKAMLEFMRTEPRREMSASEIDQLRKVAHRQPSAGGLFRYAEALALNGRVDEAKANLDLLCRLHPVPQCTTAKAAWMAVAAQGKPEMRQAWPGDWPQDQ